jgi:hypothetical protein
VQQERRPPQCHPPRSQVSSPPHSRGSQPRLRSATRGRGRCSDGLRTGRGSPPRDRPRRKPTSAQCYYSEWHGSRRKCRITKNTTWKSCSRRFRRTRHERRSQPRSGRRSWTRTICKANSEPQVLGRHSQLVCHGLPPSFGRPSSRCPEWVCPYCGTWSRSKSWTCSSLDSGTVWPCYRESPTWNARAHRHSTTLLPSGAPFFIWDWCTSLGAPTCTLATSDNRTQPKLFSGVRSTTPSAAPRHTTGPSLCLKNPLRTSLPGFPTVGSSAIGPNRLAVRM